jgi:hypothetical protein
VRQRLSRQVVLEFLDISSGHFKAHDIPLAGAEPGDRLVFEQPFQRPPGVHLTCEVDKPDAVTVRCFNRGERQTSVPAASYGVVVVK